MLQKHQTAKFNSGNINEWDISLLISVLRFSTISSAEIRRHPEVDDALRSIIDIRNNVVAHASNQKISAADFQKNWEKLKLSLLAIGGLEDDINSTLTGTVLQVKIMVH